MTLLGDKTDLRVAPCAFFKKNQFNSQEIVTLPMVGITLIELISNQIKAIRFVFLPLNNQ